MAMKLSLSLDIFSSKKSPWY